VDYAFDAEKIRDVLEGDGLDLFNWLYNLRVDWKEGHALRSLPRVKESLRLKLVELGSFLHVHSDSQRQEEMREAIIAIKSKEHLDLFLDNLVLDFLSVFRVELGFDVHSLLSVSFKLTGGECNRMVKK